MEAAVAQDPTNDGLRLHLASVLVDSGDPARALVEAQTLLATHPAWVDALEVAHRAAHASGDDELALGYRRLLGALGAGPAPLGREAPSSPGPDPVAPAGSQSPPRPASPGASARPTPSGVPDDLGGLLGSSMLGDDEELVEDPDIEMPRLTLADVGGMAEVKQRLELSFLGPARSPELRRAFGKSLRGGLLLYGPPGCGKTFVARALSGELRASFFGVGISDVLDMWVGSSERNLHEVFQQARRHAPCVLFLDELDALGMKRSNLRHAAGMRSTVNQLLVELDGVQSDNEGLFVLGATNQPWEIDAALRRPGRFDRMLFVPPPDGQARLSILARNLHNRPVEERLDLKGLAKATDGWSGADLALACESAAEQALARSIHAGGVQPITAADLRAAVAAGRSSVTSWFDLATNVATFANEGGDYDELAAYLRTRRRR